MWENRKMKVRVKATGEIIELPDIVFEFLTDEPDYWEKLKHQYAGMFTKSFLDNCDTSVDPEQIIDDAINMATSLVIKLKLKEEEK